MATVDAVGTDTLPRDDRVLPVTRWIGGVIAVVLLLAFVILYGFPHATEEYFAWTITPDVTPIVMGAGYAAGGYFFLRVITVDEWHRVHMLFPGVAAFTWAMAFATLLHWELFNYEHVSTFLWIILYVVSPFLIPALWVLNRRTDPGMAAENEQLVPSSVRLGGGVLGIGMTIVLVVLFINPSWMIDVWPWSVSPLTARVLLGWAAVFSVWHIVLAFESRWSAARISLQSLVIWFLLIFVGFVRSWNDMDPSNPLAWGLIGGMIAYLVFVFLLYSYLERT